MTFDFILIVFRLAGEALLFSSSRAKSVYQAMWRGKGSSERLLSLRSTNYRRHSWLLEASATKNPEAVMNNNITRNNNHLLSWHKDGNKKVKIERAHSDVPRTGSRRVWEVNRQGEDLISTPASAAALFCYSWAEVLVFRMGVVHVVVARLSSCDCIIIIYCLNSSDLQECKQRFGCTRETCVAFTCFALPAKLEPSSCRMFENFIYIFFFLL